MLCILWAKLLFKNATFTEFVRETVKLIRRDYICEFLIMTLKKRLLKTFIPHMQLKVIFSPFQAHVQEIFVTFRDVSELSFHDFNLATKIPVLLKEAVFSHRSWGPCVVDGIKCLSPVPAQSLTFQLRVEIELVFVLFSILT